MRVWLPWCWITNCQVVGWSFTRGDCSVQSCAFERGVLQAPGLLKGGSVSWEQGQKFSRSVVPCVIVVGKASRVSMMSDGLRYGQKQMAEKVSQQVDTLEELGSNRSSWLEMSCI